MSPFAHTVSRPLRVETLPMSPTGTCRHGARISVVAGTPYAEFDPMLSRVALDTVAKLGIADHTWYAEGRNTYWFATSGLRDAFVADWTPLPPAV